MIASDHDAGDARRFRTLHRFYDFRSRWIDHADHPDQHQILFHFIRRQRAIYLFISDTQGTQGKVRHLVCCIQEGLFMCICDGFFLSVFKYVGTFV